MYKNSAQPERHTLYYRKINKLSERIVMNETEFESFKSIIMKKLNKWFLLFCLCGCLLPVTLEAQKIRNAKFSDLPKLSQEFITKYLPDLKIEEITVDGTRKAEVEFTDGTDLEFGEEGYWHEIENDRGLSVEHLQMLPGQMLTSLKDDFGSYKIIKVDRKDLLYEVELKAKKEIKIRYDLNGQYLF